ncbi:competence protein ComJ [Polyangium sp. 6x1]|uniref:competence protein ComJ n=1 Tax=Polyangium sp. 6x1 TaxID=3042689 RepID=UPI0024830D24|nr:competence protein ComJ [Polyangium sp. 6x1]MDI1447299.1 competence protein ComJ [Polyangium sp. 6x1]
MIKFTTDISYSQIVVHWTGLAIPFSDWQQEHVDQGFAWRPGSVSFGTLDQGTADISIRRADAHGLRPDTIRAIVVPFEVIVGDRVEVASLWDQKAVVDLPPGHYRLIFEHGLLQSGDMWCDFTFVPVAAPVTAEILRADPELSPPAEFVMTAEPVCEPNRSELN